jgi:hypothetical protein
LDIASRGDWREYENNSLKYMEIASLPNRPFRIKKMNQNHAFWFTAKNLRQNARLAS